MLYRVFHVAILPLVAFYSLFATVLYPAAAYLHPHGMYESLAAHVPVGLHGLLKVASASEHSSDDYIRTPIRHRYVDSLGM